MWSDKSIGVRANSFHTFGKVSKVGVKDVGTLQTGINHLRINMKYSFKEAAINILERQSEPKTGKEISDLAISEGLIDTAGVTPEATMAAQIYLDIKKNKNSPFKKVGKGLFTLAAKTASPHSPLVIIYNQNERAKRELLERLLANGSFSI